MPETAAYASAGKMRNIKELASASRRRTGPLFGSPHAIFTTPSREELIKLKREQILNKKQAIESIKSQRVEYRIITKPARHPENSKFDMNKIKTERKPTDAELFKIVRKEAAKGNTMKQTYLDKFYQKNGISPEKDFLNQDFKTTISIFNPMDSNSNLF